MLARLEFDWFLFTIHGLLPDESARLAWSLPGVSVVLGMLSAAVWLKQLRDGEDWTVALAGWSALVLLMLTLETLMFAPVTTWLLMGPHRPSFVWVLQTYPKDCLRTAIGAPLIHCFLLYAYRWEIGDWFERALNPRYW